MDVFMIWFLLIFFWVLINKFMLGLSFVGYGMYVSKFIIKNLYVFYDLF